MQKRIDLLQRAPNLQLDSMLEAGRTSARVQTSDHHLFYQANFKGQARSALPTLVAYHMSRAFRLGCPGSIYDSNLGEWNEPKPGERERAMGYPTDITLDPRLTNKQRHSLMGNAMDANVMHTLLRVALTLTCPAKVLRKLQANLPPLIGVAPVAPATPVFLARPGRPLPVLGTQLTAELAFVASSAGDQSKAHHSGYGRRSENVQTGLKTSQTGLKLFQSGLKSFRPV